MSPLFDRVVEVTRISELFATTAVARACERAGVSPRRLSPSSLKLALPEIEKTVRTFCCGEVEQIMSQLQELTNDSPRRG